MATLPDVCVFADDIYDSKPISEAQFLAGYTNCDWTSEALNGAFYTISSQLKEAVDCIGTSGSASTVTIDQNTGIITHGDGAGSTTEIDLPLIVSETVDSAEANAIFDKGTPDIRDATAVEIAALDSDDDVIVLLDDGTGTGDHEAVRVPADTFFGGGGKSIMDITGDMVVINGAQTLDLEDYVSDGDVVRFFGPLPAGEDATIGDRCNPQVVDAGGNPSVNATNVVGFSESSDFDLTVYRVGANYYFKAAAGDRSGNHVTGSSGAGFSVQSAPVADVRYLNWLSGLRQIFPQFVIAEKN